MTWVLGMTKVWGFKWQQKSTIFFTVNLNTLSPCWGIFWAQSDLFLMVLHWGLLQHLWIEVEIQLLVLGSIHVKTPKSPDDFFVDCLLILQHILLKNLRDLWENEHRTIWKLCFVLPNYYIWFSHQFWLVGTTCGSHASLPIRGGSTSRFPG